MLSDKRAYQDRRRIKLYIRGRLAGRTLVSFCAWVIPQILPWIMRFIQADFDDVHLGFGDTVIGLSLLMLLLSFVTTTFVTDPMAVRVAAFFIKLSGDPENLPSPLSVCDCFGPGYAKLVRAMLLRRLRIFAWALALLCVGALIPGSFEIVEVAGIADKVLHMSNVFAAFALVALGLYTYCDLSYMMVPYVLADDPALSAGEALRRGRCLTRGRIMELFVLQLSFFGWFMVMPLLIGLYVYPYREGTMAAYYLAFVKDTPPESDREPDAA
ncbi:MAG: DUF975 family protein [Firmicutes bacterium]|nr:DUF975 family protein [Bacillota bacterium]